MEPLLTIVTQLEHTQPEPEQLALLQSLCDLLLTEYCLCPGNGPDISPLWVEAYYFHPGKFEDGNSHHSPQQMDRFGRLYFHSKGYGGVDVCLSRGDYCLSLLVKYALIHGELYSQVPLWKYLRALREADPGLAERPVLKRLPPEARDGRPVFHSPRKGLVKGDYHDALLASIKGVGEFPFRYEKGYGMRQLLQMANK